jgi:branched-chain amino acid transport system substrate-binding protein
LSIGSIAGAADQPITIPVILPLTGPGAFIGQTHQKSLQILEGVVNKDGGVNGRPVKFDFLDDQSSPQVAKQLASQDQSGLPVVLGSALAAMCNAIGPVYESSSRVNYCLSPSIFPTAGSFVFSSGTNTVDDLVAIVRFLREKGWKKIALIATTDSSGQDGANDLLEALKLPVNSGLSLVASERFNPGDVSVSAQLARVKAASPQALVVMATGPAFANVLHAVQDIGLDVPLASTPANMVGKQLEQYASFMPKELYFPGVTYAAGIAPNAPVKHEQDVYNTAMKAAGVTTDFQTGMPWDAGLIVVDALRKLGPSATGAQVRDYIAKLKNFAGILGVYDFTKFPQRGVGIDDVVMMRWAAGSGWSNASSFGGALR